MKLSYIINALEEFAPRALQESWDNSGLQIALPDGDGECTGALVCVDVTEETVAEAAEAGFNLIVAHHPLIFKGFRTLTPSSAPQRAALAAVRAGIAVYCAHTNLDSTLGGVSYGMARLLDAEVERVLSPAAVDFKQITVYCPRSAAADVRLALLDHNAGVAPCTNGPSTVAFADAESESLGGLAQDLTLDLRHTPLTRVSALLPGWLTSQAVQAVRSVPGAADCRIDISPLANTDSALGLGVVANLRTQCTMASLVSTVKERFAAPVVKASGGYDPDQKVSRIALCGGAGGEFIATAQAMGAQVYISADIRYHDFADHRTGMAILDIGHFESESCAKTILMQVISNKFTNFAVRCAHTDTNPVRYL